MKFAAWLESSFVKTVNLVFKICYNCAE